MNTLKIASVLLTTAIMTGCASTSSEPTGSYARQVATAGGLRLEDHKVPKAQYEAALTSVTDAGLNTSVLASSHGFNMNGGAALGVGLAAWLFSPEAPEQRDAVIAFAPMSLGDKQNAGKAFALTLAKAYQNAFKEVGNLEVSEVQHTNFLGERYFVSGKGPLCRDNQNEQGESCLFAASIETPVVRTSPRFMGMPSRETYVFQAKDKVLIERNVYGSFDKRVFLMNVSKHLPDWAYVYAAPVPKVSPPMIFHKGEVHYFVVPDA
ncbi:MULTISPECIES: hypothetical protein [unclassified Pseudomonas]|uniref:hypothetical protein n=1 Tax=unclassified Pseudomonas TaxID=196821 RepID=UPI00257C5A81|nr:MULTISPECIES: hypothetical protein [unclassified Pseudomonas]